MKRVLTILGVIALGVLLSMTVISGKKAARYPLWETVKEWKTEYQIVDLTHAFFRGIPVWPGFPPMRIDTLYWYAEGEGVVAKQVEGKGGGYGFFAEYFCHVGQYGTHCDPGCHFHKGGETLDEIPASEMVCPLVVFDVRDKAKENPDYELTVDDIKAWEAKYGPIPEGAFCLMWTGWSERWPDPDKMRNVGPDGYAHYPAWGMEALKYLFEERHVTAVGHETTDTDGGLRTSRDGDYSCEAYVLTKGWQIELVNVPAGVELPEAGGIAIVTFPKARGGSGFPARVIAIIPK